MDITVAGLYGHLLKSPSEAYVRELVGHWYRQKLHISDYCELSDKSTIIIRDKLEALGLIKPRSIIAGFSNHIAWSLTEGRKTVSRVGAHTNRQAARDAIMLYTDCAKLRQTAEILSRFQ